MTIALSPLDTKHFNIRIARCRSDDSLNASSIDNWCINNNIDMVIVRCDANENSIVSDLLNNNFNQEDILVWYRKNLTVVPEMPANIRHANEKDLFDIENIARSAFTNYNGHYHQDKRLDAIKSTEAYVNWALSSNDGIEKFVYDDGIIRGFVLVDTIRGEVPLYAVNISSQGQGIGKNLIRAALNICKARGREIFSISTQENNLKSIGVWKSLGFEFNNAFRTFHKWYT